MPGVFPLPTRALSCTICYFFFLSCTYRKFTGLGTLNIYTDQSRNRFISLSILLESISQWINYLKRTFNCKLYIIISSIAYIYISNIIMDRFNLELLRDSLFSQWENCAPKIRCLRPLSEVCWFSKKDWKTVERPEFGKLYK